MTWIWKKGPTILALGTRVLSNLDTRTEVCTFIIINLFSLPSISSWSSTRRATDWSSIWQRKKMLGNMFARLYSFCWTEILYLFQLYHLYFNHKIQDLNLSNYVMHLSPTKNLQVAYFPFVNLFYTWNIWYFFCRFVWGLSARLNLDSGSIETTLG